MTATASPNALKNPVRRRLMQPSRVAIFLTPLIALLASPAGAFALNINDEYRPQDEFELTK
ncbi:MAG TPA: hypothetical protein VGM33_19780, partial [Baekduia sp.]